jgi:uncharacterized protein YdeI (YjbR/CyaY-like superfamily)
MGEPRHTFATQSEWEAWLEGNGSASPGVWLRLAKKSAEQPARVKVVVASVMQLGAEYADRRRPG